MMCIAAGPSFDTFSSICSVLPITLESAPKRRSHSEWLMTTTRSALVSSLMAIPRPRIGETPSTEKRLPETNAPARSLAPGAPESVIRPAL
jgi:hypothetical protein